MPYRIMRLLCLAALLTTAACSNSPAGHTQLGLASFQTSALAWDEVAAANTAAKVSNDKLIMMR